MSLPQHVAMICLSVLKQPGMSKTCHPRPAHFSDQAGWAPLSSTGVRCQGVNSPTCPDTWSRPTQASVRHLVCTWPRRQDAELPLAGSRAFFDQATPMA
eukprot:4157965-Amphidinium_carterae.1